jgi:hypothetical protein
VKVAEVGHATGKGRCHRPSRFVESLEAALSDLLGDFTAKLGTRVHRPGQLQTPTCGACVPDRWAGIIDAAPQTA